MTQYQFFGVFEKAKILWESLLLSVLVHEYTFLSKFPQNKFPDETRPKISGSGSGQKSSRSATLNKDPQMNAPKSARKKNLYFFNTTVRQLHQHMLEIGEFLDRT
jgi:hypothetical protein